MQDVLDEIVVFDLDRNKAHSLNPTAAAVWTQCVRQTPRAEAVDLLSQKLGPGRGETALDYALAQLQRARLLQDPVAQAEGMSRRAVMRRIGLAAAAGLPIVTSLAAPPALHAQSCKPAFEPCVEHAECCSGICEGGLFCQARFLGGGPTARAVIAYHRLPADVVLSDLQGSVSMRRHSACEQVPVRLSSVS